ncbi:MAG: UvrD-helicase domain-containing protein, partial [FCB group bacterium]
MSEEKDTREQKLAQAYDRHIAVTANAGSGKTTVLNKRYLNILYNPSHSSKLNCEPKEIVAITFTRKAATEIKAKIAKSIEAQIKANQSGRDLEKLLYIRDHLSNSRITTIHSFCSSILRDFPIETGVSPNFVELSETDVINLKTNAIISTMEGWLSEYNSEKRHKANMLFKYLNRKKVENYLKILLDRREILYSLRNYYENKTDDEILSVRDDELYKIIFPSLLQFIEQLKFIFDNLNYTNFKTNERQDYENICKQVNEQYLFLEKSVKENKLVGINNLQSAFDLLENLRNGTVINKGYSIGANFLKKNINIEIPTLKDEINNNLKFIKSYLDSIQFLDHDPEMI